MPTIKKIAILGFVQLVFQITSYEVDQGILTRSDKRMIY